MYTTITAPVIPDIAGNDFPRRRESILSLDPSGSSFVAPQQPSDHLHRSCSVDYLGAGLHKSSYVYILASGLNGTIYVGVTSDLIKRVSQHREGLADGFTKRYGVKDLVWYEVHTEIMEAIRREKQIKKWERRWKVELIQKGNPVWRDLYADIT